MNSKNRDLEKKLLAGLLQYPSFIESKIQSIDKDFFHYHEEKSIFESIKFYFTGYKGLLSLEVFIQYLENNNVDFDKRLSYTELFNELQSIIVDQSELQFIFDELRDLKLRGKLLSHLATATTSLDSKRGIEIVDDLEKLLSTLKSEGSEVTVSRGSIGDSIDDRKQLYLDRQAGKGVKGYLFGLKSLDDLTDGIQKQELCVVSARTASGKSRMLFNMGYNMSEQGYNVMYVTLEMYLQQIERLYDSRSAGVSYFRLKKGRLTPEEEQRYFSMLEDQRERPKSFYIVNIPRGCTISVLESEILNFERSSGKKVDVLIVDYLTLMVPTETNQNTSIQYGNLARDLKALGRLRDMAVITASQVNRGAVDAQQVGLEHLSLSDPVGWHSDLVLYLQQSKEERAKNVLNCRVLKYRDGANISVYMFVNWDLSYIGEEVLPYG